MEKFIVHTQAQPLGSNVAESRTVVPASSFGIVLGMAGLGNCWHMAQSYWEVSHWIPDVLCGLTTVIWFALVIGFIYKWFFQKDFALAELNHPVQCCFIGLLPLSTLLVAMWIYAFFPALAVMLIVLSVIGQLGFSMYRFGGMWRGGRRLKDTTAVIYLPSVAGNFVSAIALAGIGYIDFGKLLFGAGLFSWLALESTIINRLLVEDELSPAIRPTLGIQLAPPVVGAVAYLGVSGGEVDLFFFSLMGYGFVQLLFLMRLLPWFWRSGLNPSFWAFSFGITAVTLACMRAGTIAPHSFFASAAPFIFILANVAVIFLFILTAWLLMIGRLFKQQAFAAGT
ncbi:dicarboxylate transporter/tellurite-resistance protein TehA [Pseudomonas abietaniphila]|uniref:Tellurite resistance protein n=1 Tax=Pseudomonas abietaniphila TaxID=89065 RepID=A0A1G8PTA6_9PSED|nr:dicarboxylate transporter/tellurite-resistance protein TehA [Pseudomonas abietaniphila]SDI95568.1 tellurite resistance protein [Pseudomonas abietaniphila]